MICYVTGVEMLNCLNKMLESSVTENQTFIILLPSNGQVKYSDENHSEHEEYSLSRSYNEIILESILKLDHNIKYVFLYFN